MPFQLYNSWTNRTEPFTPQNPNRITFYTCGPTVYDDAHIGNFRSFLAADLLRRWLESPLCTLKTAEGEHNGPRRVLHVMNITDVGHMTDDDTPDGGGQDKMELAKQRILESKKSGKLPPDAQVDPTDPLAIARFYEARFKEDAIQLGLKVAIEDRDRDPKTPTLMPRATDHIEGMKQVIAQLLNDHFAYTAGQPGARAIYFDVRRFERYGQLSGNTLDQLKGGAGGRVDDTQQQEKHHQADFLLWKEDESHTMKWPAPNHPDCENWAKGYPGWHIECTAMALDRLVDGKLEGARANHSTIDLHSGGEDNIFPHHECEIAQSCCFTGNDHFANHWFHPRFLMVEGQKMSKSKGTMYTLRELTAKGIDPAAIRLELIKTHYRANADFSMQGLEQSAKRIRNWRILTRRFQYASVFNLDAFEYRSFLDTRIEKMVNSLNNDLNIAEVVGQLDGLFRHGLTESNAFEQFDAAEEQILPIEPADVENSMRVYSNTNESRATRNLAAIHLIDNILGVIFRPTPKNQDTGIALYQPGVTPSPEIESLLTQRAEAKKSKDFAAADAIRDQLTAMGLSIMDKPHGQVEVAPTN